MSATIFSFLTRLAESGPEAILSAHDARPLGSGVLDRLLARRVLEEQRPLSAWDVCRACECGLLDRPVRRANGCFRADCPLDPRQDVVLNVDDLRTFRIGHAALAREIATAAGLDREPAEIATDIWRLGATESGRAVFLVLVRAVALQDGLVPMLRQAARGVPVTLLGPELPPAAAMRLEDAGLHHVVTADAVADGAAHLAAALTPGGAEPGSSAPPLLYRASAGQAEVHGRTVTLSHQLAPVFRRLIERARTRDPVVSGPELEGDTGREAKDLVRELRAAFVAGGLAENEARALIANVRGRGWRIGLPADEILLAG